MISKVLIMAAVGAVLSITCWQNPSLAEVGVTDTQILLGESAAFSGPSGSLGTAFAEGADQYFSLTNSEGGVYGRRIVVIRRDDQYEPDQALRNTRELIEKEKVFALFGYVGTPTVKACLPLIREHGVPLVAPVTGAQLIRHLSEPLVFNIRASYHDEIDSIVSYLQNYDRTDIAIVYQDDAYGRDGLVGALGALRKRGLAPSATATVKRNSSDTNSAGAKIVAAKPQAVIIISAYGSVASFVKYLRANGSDAQVMNVSFVGGSALAKSLGANAHGIGISQVVPFPWNERVPIVREYHQAIARNASKIDYGFYSLEGFIAAKVFVTALREVGSQPTREKLVDALESMRGRDFGGFTITFTPESHDGSDFSELTFIIGAKGAFIH